MTFDEQEKTIRKRERIERNYERYMEKSGNAKAEKEFGKRGLDEIHERARVEKRDRYGID
jgi:chorismate mutase